VEVDRPFRPARLTQRPELIPIDPAHAAAQLPEATDHAQHQLVRALRQGDEAGTRELATRGREKETRPPRSRAGRRRSPKRIVASGTSRPRSSRAAAITRSGEASIVIEWNSRTS
jgi:hypothetical protein